MLMGGGGSFSAGGPGKGMHSRLCKFYLYLLVYSWLGSMIWFFLCHYAVYLYSFPVCEEFSVFLAYDVYWLYLYTVSNALTYFDYLQMNPDLRVLNEYQQIQSFSAFNSIFNNTGLFGIYASTVRHNLCWT